jgi:hypothetical protein
MSAHCSDRGIDTVRFRWRTDNVAYLKFQQRPEGTIEGYRGERFEQTPLGRIGVYPDGLVYMEGRAQAILLTDKDDHTLCQPDNLISAERVARSLVQDAGVPLGNEGAQLGRVDLASELRFSDGYDGSAFLHSLASLDAPWCKSRVDGRKGDSIETVSFHNTRGKSILLRAYDKGVESGTHLPGHRIRVERQRRFRKEREPNVAMFVAADLRKMYVGREFESLAHLSRTSYVCNVPDALRLLLESDLPDATVERLAGFLVVGRHLDYNRVSLWRRSAELRSLGIAVDPAAIEMVEVPVGRYLEALSSAWAIAA